ncbi:hypothetical protein G9H71_22560 [Motilibacter sp. E257]|uniref:Uncharacterized protein n=1 Tax=Motilibacter deserti TaxID=2714956 RepID=A0ABX0H3G4_9ACTN|nr:hypothetical protein [Motilibacter deserti]
MTGGSVCADERAIEVARSAVGGAGVVGPGRRDGHWVGDRGAGDRSRARVARQPHAGDGNAAHPRDPRDRGEVAIVGDDHVVRLAAFAVEA